MLKDLNIKKFTGEKYTDVEKAVGIIDIIFDQVGKSIREDRSKVKLNMIQKGMIQGMLGDKVKNSIRNYVINMNNSDIRSLVESIRKEVNK